MASIWEYANPLKFMRTTEAALPFIAVAAAVFLVTGLGWGFFFTPDDFRQGSTVKIFYIHVPSAMMAINIWVMIDHVVGLDRSAASRKRIGSSRSCTCWCNHDTYRAFHRRGLGAANVGNMVGMGSALNVLPDPISFLLGVYGALECDRKRRYRC